MQASFYILSHTGVFSLAVSPQVIIASETKSYGTKSPKKYKETENKGKAKKLLQIRRLPTTDRPMLSSPAQL